MWLKFLGAQDRPRSALRRPKIAPRRPKIDPKINQNFNQFSVSILDRFGVVLGPQLGVIFGQISSPNRLGTGFTSKTPMFTKQYENQYKINKNAPRAPPKTTQNRPKSVPRGDFFALKCRPRFGIDFGAILAPKMPPFGQPFGDQNRSKNYQEFDCAKCRLKIATRPPKTSLGPPQERPKTP